MSPLKAVLVEAFSETPLGGNGAAVVLLPEPAPTPWMQRLAGSLKQSETAFLLPMAGGWALRWFTPRVEVPLCGHATLAALVALGHWGQLPEDGRTTFHTRSGPLPVGLRGAQARLELPRHALEPWQPPEELARLLGERWGLTPEATWRSALDYQVVLLPPTAPLAALEGVAEALTGAARSGLVLMQALDPSGEGGPRVGGEAAAYQLRFFAPGMGIDEDPVTGSAHALVAPYWLERLQRPRVVGWQCSDRPGGMVCEAGSSGMIRLTGFGHLLWEGTLRVEPEHCSGPLPPGGGPASEASLDWRQACGP
ncbi:MAG: PhzF family phenazine biosynthesis protein [Cyanobacteriota bacterium]|nr:PhzF family phenazine biosynthesis protein [Cyanobacteriota bacterium]